MDKFIFFKKKALAVSGLIWTRWCLVITPRNVMLSVINFSVSMTGFYQLSRIIRYIQRKEKRKGFPTPLITETLNTMQVPSNRCIQTSAATTFSQELNILYLYKLYTTIINIILAVILFCMVIFLYA
jgi:L-asparagine transporter-like permease